MMGRRTECGMIDDFEAKETIKNRNQMRGLEIWRASNELLFTTG